MYLPFQFCCGDDFPSTSGFGRLDVWKSAGLGICAENCEDKTSKSIRVDEDEMLSWHIICLVLYVLVLSIWWVDAVPELCPNKCSGHGVCGPGPGGRCHCFPGFVGMDCSLRACPSAKAWVDVPIADNLAHAPFTECGNMGSCNRTTGLCECYAGFTGAACEANLCPIDLRPETMNTTSIAYALCSGKGRCLSLREASLHQDFHNFRGTEEYSDWDADRLFGCVCDPGFEGPSCSRMSCPTGDDSLTRTVYAEQLVDCMCTTCSGSMQLSYGGQVTVPVPYTAAPSLLQRVLRRLPGLDRVTVSSLEGDALCSVAGSVFAVTFVGVSSPLAMTITALSSSFKAQHLGVRVNGFSSHVNPYLKSRAVSDVEALECSGHGICDYATGTCQCFSGYMSSDGFGGAGTRGDCGYAFNATTSYETADNQTAASACAVRDNLVCSGHGTCAASLRKCLCDDGYDGFDCSRMACLTAKRWVGAVGADHANEAVCAGVGTCNIQNGYCYDCGIFSGKACEFFGCPRDSTGRQCGGNGTCLTLRELAGHSWNDRKTLRNVVYDEPWDADSIRGCLCYRAISVDNQYPTSEGFFLEDNVFNSSNYMRNISKTFTRDQDLTRFYRGPFAHAATDFAGYDCGEMLCPKGDDPRTPGVNEVQAVVCWASQLAMSSNAWLQFQFRHNISRPLYANTSLADLKSALEEMFTIGVVELWANEDYLQGLEGVNSQPNATVCNPTANITIFVEFPTEHGSLPLLEVVDSWSTDSSLIAEVSRVRAGTTEDIECSGLGICNAHRGRCSCLHGYFSSNGSTTGPGEKGDCSYRNPHLSRFLSVTGD